MNFHEQVVCRFYSFLVACFSTLWELYANYLGVARMYNRVTIIQHLFSSYFTIALNRLDQQSRFSSSYGYWSTLCHTYLETYDIMHISSLLCVFYLVIQLCLLQLWQSQCCQLLNQPSTIDVIWYFRKPIASHGLKLLVILLLEALCS